MVLFVSHPDLKTSIVEKMDILARAIYSCEAGIAEDEKLPQIRRLKCLGRRKRAELNLVLLCNCW